MKAIATVLFAFLGPALAAHAGLSVERQPGAIVARGDHFVVTIDAAAGGEIASVMLHDGAQWISLFAGPTITFPMFEISDGTNVYALPNDHDAELVDVTAAPDKTTCVVRATPRTLDGKTSPWRVTLTYEIHPEGAVFVDVDCDLNDGDSSLAQAGFTFAVADAIRQGPKYRDQNVATQGGGFPSARVAFGINPERTFTNEVEAFVEYKHAMTGAAGFEQKDGRVTWTIGDGGATLTAPFHYHNRLALGFGAAVTGRPKSNVIGQRVYHWVNWLDKENWYPTDAQIDKMLANHATMLVLHHEWMLQRGSNGYPHADYRVIRNRADMLHSIGYAHAKGLRVGLYMRGVEMYALNTSFFERYCRRNWDGIYVDWHGPTAVSWHENKYDPEPALGDTHFSEDGAYVPARDYFMFTRHLRDVVGPQGFLIGHQGSFNSGVLANLCFDAYLPGETGSDRAMFSDLDEAAYKGMLGGGVCMPWTLDLPRFRNAEGTAKMAAWGVYPHIVLGIKARHTDTVVFPCEADDPLYAFVLPYWRILAHIDVENATLYNAPAQNLVAVASSNPDFHSVVYKAGDHYLLITANLGQNAAKAELTLDAALLGMTGEYAVERIDPATGDLHPHGTTTGAVTTSELPQWGLEGFKLSKK